MDYRLWIDGKWVNSQNGITRKIENPATGEILAEVQEAGPADVDGAVQAAHKAW